MTHRWSDPERPDPNHTYRRCIKCPMVQIHRHEPDNDPPHWYEYAIGDGPSVASARVPKCERL